MQTEAQREVRYGRDADRYTCWAAECSDHGFRRRWEAKDSGSHLLRWLSFSGWAVHSFVYDFVTEPVAGGTRQTETAKIDDEIVQIAIWGIWTRWELLVCEEAGEAISEPKTSTKMQDRQKEACQRQLRSKRRSPGNFNLGECQHPGPQTAAREHSGQIRLDIHIQPAAPQNSQQLNWYVNGANIWTSQAEDLARYGEEVEERAIEVNL